jgi:hypothetical protein
LKKEVSKNGGEINLRIRYNERMFRYICGARNFIAMIESHEYLKIRRQPGESPAYLAIEVSCGDRLNFCMP